MGWESDLQQASFRGILIDCISTNDGSTKSLAIQQAPYSNDAIVEDMGKDPNKINLRIFLSGENYLTYLNALDSAFSLSGEGELIHPIHGIKNVFVYNWNVNHNAENVNGCDLDVEFLVAKSESKPLFVPQPQSNDISTSEIISSPAIAFERELTRIKNSDTNTFYNTVNKINNGLKKTYQLLNTVRATVDDILSPAKWATDIVNDVISISTFEYTDISAISKWRSVVDRVNRVSKVFQDETIENTSFEQLWRAIGIASSVAAAQSILKQTRTDIVQQKTQSITPIELAIVRQQVRKDIQNAINSERNISQQQADKANIDPLLQVINYKKLANNIHDQFQELIEIRPPLSSTNISIPCTSQWLAHVLYGDMSRSEEIKRLNPTVQNFAVLRSSMELITYAR